MMKLTSLLLILLEILLLNQAKAESSSLQTSFPALPVTQEAIKVDGNGAEAFWKQALVVELAYEIRPGNNIKPPVKTLARIIMGKNALFVLVEAMDPNPQLLRTAYRFRDSVFNDDYIRVGLNTTGKNLKASYFYVTAAGVQSDAAYDQTTRKFGFEWNALWSSAVKNYADKYVVEIKIPLNQIRINPNISTWGIQIDRNYPRERPYIISASRQERASNCIVCDFNNYKVKSQKVSKENNGLLIPTIVSKNNKSRNLANNLDYNDSTKNDFGLDFSWKASENMNVTATLNPDFSQVEVDELQLNINTQFSLFFEEKRNFFNDATDFFSVPGNLFYSRSIVDPDWGLKATGDTGNISWGLLTARDNVTKIILPSVDASSNATLNTGSDVAVFRAVNKFSDDFSLGFALLSKSDKDYFNRVADIDFNYRLNESNNFSGYFIGSDTEYPTIFLQQQNIAKQPGADTGYYFQYEFNGDNFGAKARYQKLGANFRADSGFVNQVGFTRYKLTGNYTWYFNDKDGDYYFFDQGKLKINKEDIKNTKQQSVDSNYGISYEVSGKWATLFEFGYLNSDLLIEQKLLNESGWFIFAQYNPFQLLNLEYSYVQGNAVDFDNARQGYSKSGILTISSTVGMHFTLSAAIENEVLDINGEQLFDASIYDLRGTWFFNADHSLRVVTRFQDYKQNAALYTFPVDNRYRELSSQLTYRYQIDPYTLLFAGYSSGALSNDRYRNFKQNDRTIFLKASYAYGF